MDKSKAKKAVNKAKSRKSSAPAGAGQMMAEPMANMPGINPEIQAASPALQPADGYVNPYRFTGSVAPIEYAAGNMLPGLQAPQMVNR